MALEDGRHEDRLKSGWNLDRGGRHCEVVSGEIEW